MGTFRCVFVGVFQICHSFSFANMRFLVKVIFFLLNPTRRFTFMESLLQNFVISFFTSHMFPWMNKFLFTENSFLPRLIKQESSWSSHYIFQSVYALNTRSIKLHRRSVVKVLIMLLIKQ